MNQKWQHRDQTICLGGIEYIGCLIRLKSNWIVRKPMMTAENVTKYLYKSRFCHNVLGLGMDMVKNEMVWYRCRYQGDSILF